MSDSSLQAISGVLHIVAQTELTEIRVSDARFNSVPLSGGNSGDVMVDVPEGVYQIAFRDGSSWQTSPPVLVLAGQTIEVHQSPDLSVPSIVPFELPQPSTSHLVSLGGFETVGTISQLSPVARSIGSNYSIDLAETSDDVSTSRFRAENLVVCVRGSRDNGNSLETTGEGLSVIGSNDQVILPSIEIPGIASVIGFQIPPGYWRLRLQTSVGGVELEMPLYISPGWKMHISCPRCAYRDDTLPRADLANSIIRLMADTGGPEDATAAKLRKAESNALQSLSKARPLYGNSLKRLLRELLNNKSVNPMLGLYGAYLLPCESDEDVSLLSEIAQHLDELFCCGPMRTLLRTGLPHPDVQALLLRRSLLRHEQCDNIKMDHPPLLRAGWNIVREASVKFPNVISVDSPIDSMAANLWGPSVWVIWRRPDPSRTMLASRAVTETISLCVDSSITSPSLAAASIDTDAALIDTGLHYTNLREWFRTGLISSKERVVGQAIHRVAEDESSQQFLDRITFLLPSTVPAKRTWTVETLSAAVQMPASTVARAIRSLAMKLVSYANSLELDLKGRSPMSRPNSVAPYDPMFLGDGFDVPLPSLQPALQSIAYADGAVLDYTHFSLVMHSRRRVATYAAYNVDGSRLVRLSANWLGRMDERAGEYQLGPDAFPNGRIDRGQLVRSVDVVWGSVSEARAANNDASFCTNVVPQHQVFSQDEWAALTEWMLSNATDFSYRLCVFAGPVLHDDDPTLSDLPANVRVGFNAHGTVKIPAALWKLFVLRDARAGGDDLSAVAFVMKQSESWNDAEGRRLRPLKVHQVTIGAIERWTGLDFGYLRDADELQWSEPFARIGETNPEPEWPAIRSATDIIYSGVSRRARGIRAPRADKTGVSINLTTRNRLTRQLDKSSCGCEASDAFDAREAIAALSRDLAHLTDMVGAIRPEEVVGGARAAMGAAAAQPEELGDQAESRILDIVAAAPANLKDQITDFAQKIVRQGEVYRGHAPAPAPVEFTRIVGGDQVPPGGFLSCCCVGDSTRWFCSGVVVAPQVALTAGHCGANIRRIMVGGNQVTPTLSAGSRIIGVRNVIIHPTYRPSPYDENDINILILDTPVGVAPAPLAVDDNLRNAESVELVGFGYNDPERPLGFGVKRRVQAPLGPIKLGPTGDLGQLPETLGFHGDYEFVAGRKGLGRDSCNGDSGGPAYISANNQFYLAGLTSRATRTASVNCGDGGIYVRPQFFIDWIREATKKAGITVSF